MFVQDEHLQMMRGHRALAADTPPIRLFRSKYLEFFTHTPVIVVPLFWGPIALLYALKGYQVWPSATPWWWFLAALALGCLLLWTLVEYVIHRFLFHCRPRTRWQEELLFLFHGIHHVQPHAPTRLVMPLSVSIPLGALFIGIFQRTCGWVGHPYLSYPALAGFALGYISYDVLHYGVHHWQVRAPWFKRLKRHHMEHHFKTPDQRFGVTSDRWDRLFGTLPPRPGTQPGNKGA